jgi:hypothetical protein
MSHECTRDAQHTNSTNWPEGAAREQTSPPEGRVPDLDLRQHTDGNWPSSRNVSQ